MRVPEISKKIFLETKNDAAFETKLPWKNANDFPNLFMLLVVIASVELHKKIDYYAQKIATQ